MRIYEAPFLLDEEPRLIGGKMTLRQGAYVLSGAAVGLAILDRLFFRSAAMAVVLILLVLGVACFLAFYKVRGVDLYIDAYVMRLWSYKCRTHGYVYSRISRR